MATSVPLWTTVTRTLRDAVTTGPLGAGVAGVSNFGDSASWAGVLSMANAYAFGRLAWAPALPAAQVLDEWVASTFGTDPVVRAELEPLVEGDGRRHATLQTLSHAEAAPFGGVLAARHVVEQIRTAVPGWNSQRAR